MVGRAGFEPATNWLGTKFSLEQIRPFPSATPDSPKAIIGRFIIAIDKKKPKLSLIALLIESP